MTHAQGCSAVEASRSAVHDALSWRPQDPRALALASAIADRCGPASEADALFGRWAQTQPDNLLIAAWRGERALWAGRREDAARLWQPEVATLVVERASALGRHDADRAVETLRTLMLVDRLDWLSMMKIGAAALLLGAPDAAAEAYARATTLNPVSPEPYLQLATSLHAKGDLAGARSTLDRGLATSQPPHADLYHLRSKMAADARNLASAESDARLAVAERPGSGVLQVWLGDVLFGRGRFDEARRQYRRALDAADWSGWRWAARQRLALAFDAEGHRTEAIAECERALQESLWSRASAGTLAQNHAVLADYLIRDGQTEPGRQHAQRALVLDPGNALARRLSGAE